MENTLYNYYKNTYGIQQKQAKEAVLIVDYQNDFVHPEKGSLYVPGGEKLAPKINKIIQEVKSRNGLILASRELHPAGHISFASNYIGKEAITKAFARGETPSEKNYVTLEEINSGKIKLAPKADFKIQELKAYIKAQENQMDALWPDHCVENTFGAEYYEKLDKSLIDIEIKKGFESNSHPYSVFGGKTLDEKKTTLEILKDFGVKIVKIVGVATEYCDLATALDAKKYGFEVQFIQKATAGVDPAATIEALNKMREAGIKIID